MTSYLKKNYLLSYEKYSKFDISNPFIHVRVFPYKCYNITYMYILYKMTW